VRVVSGALVCTNQSCTWNWIQAAASTLRIVAGWNFVRVMTALLIARGLGFRRLAESGNTSVSGTLRPKRVPVLPIIGHFKSL